MSTTTEHAEPTEAAPPARENGGNGVGIASFLCGALALGPIAVVLGLIGLARYRDGRASRRSWPLAGLILGVVGTLALAAAAVVYVTSDASAVTADTQARVDVIGVGNATVDHFMEDPTATAVALSVTEGGYDVAGEAVPALLEGERGLTATVVDAYEWCVELAYEGGTQPTVAFGSTQGFLETGTC